MALAYVGSGGAAVTPSMAANTLAIRVGALLAARSCAVRRASVASTLAPATLRQAVVRRSISPLRRGAPQLRQQMEQIFH